MIRVGKIRYKRGKKILPHYDGFYDVVVLTKCTKYGSLGPYVLKDENGSFMENIWQFSKVYEHVPATIQRYSRWNKTITWDWPEEKHVDKNGKLTDSYWNWRKTGFECKYPIRYPVGMKHRKNCLYSMWDGKKLDYIEARIQIYFSTYDRLVRNQEQFYQLKQMLKDGKNILIHDVDGPCEELLEYYKQKWKVSDDFIVDHTMLATEENLSIMISDTQRSFGHGYCLAMSLLDLTVL